MPPILIPFKPNPYMPSVLKAFVPREYLRMTEKLISTDSLHQVNGMVKYKDHGKPTILCELGNNYKGLSPRGLKAAISEFP